MRKAVSWIVIVVLIGALAAFLLWKWGVKFEHQGHSIVISWPHDENESAANKQDICRLQGVVVKVTDGDSIKVRDRFGKKHTIRLAGIDAPELKQHYGVFAKDVLDVWVKDKAVCVSWYKKDRYRRKVAKVYLKGWDVNLEMLKNGYAWHYKYYQDEQTEEDRALYAQAEKDAKRDQLGFWGSEGVVPPWEWRKR